MNRILPERKSAALAKLLQPYNMTVTVVAQMEGISEATLYYWRNKAKAEGIPVPGADKTTDQWSAEARLPERQRYTVTLAAWDEPLVRLLLARVIFYN